MAPSHEKQIPEYAPTSTEIATALTEAQHMLYKVGIDPAFRARCLDTKLNPDTDIDKPPYWDVFAGYVEDRVAILREHNGNSVRASAIELLSATPAYLYAKAALYQDEQHNGSNRQHDRGVTSHYNNLLRNFAINYPEAHVSDVVMAQLKVTNLAIEDRAVRQNASQLIKNTVYGAKHELGFGQILARTGHTFRPATQYEDLQGVDYVIDENTRNPLYIDVKASFNQIGTPEHPNRPFKMTREGHTVMYSLISSSEFGDKFFITDEAAEQKAPLLNQLLTQAKHTA